MQRDDEEIRPAWPLLVRPKVVQQLPELTRRQGAGPPGLTGPRHHHLGAQRVGLQSAQHALAVLLYGSPLSALDWQAVARRSCSLDSVQGV
jgi:hypothetical protein